MKRITFTVREVAGQKSFKEHSSVFLECDVPTYSYNTSKESQPPVVSLKFEDQWDEVELVFPDDGSCRLTGTVLLRGADFKVCRRSSEGWVIEVILK